MPEVPLIGQTPKTDETPAFIEAKTAFIIYIDKDGLVAVSTDLNAPIVIDAPPTPHELWSAVASVKKNIESMETAMQTAQITLGNIPSAMMAFQKQMMEIQQNQAIVGKLGAIK